MSSRLRKTFPPGTFIPTSQRLMAIGQLCIAFSVMLWYLVQPFMGEYFTLRSRMLLYEYAMGTSDILKSRKGQEEKLKRQAERFQQLTEDEQQLLIKDYEDIRSYAKRPPFQKIVDGLRTLIQDVPPFEQAWIFFSITISILILLKVEGAKLAAWLLPLIVLAYCLDNQLTGQPSSLSADFQLFPTEQEVIQYYLHEPLSSSFLNQKEQLEKGWKRYLIENWSKSRHGSQEEHLEEGEFQFNLARLYVLHGQRRSEWLNHFHEELNPLFLYSYMLWNVLFAWFFSRSSCNKGEIKNDSINHSLLWNK